MPKKRPKPATPLAKGEAALMKLCRREHPKFDDDAARLGTLTAVYNAGFLAGDANRKRKAKR
jgi:hypothetical protein